jgi:hypothetical protein
MVEHVRADQAQKLDVAIDGGLDYLPRLLRGTVRSILFR